VSTSAIQVQGSVHASSRAGPSQLLSTCQSKGRLELRSGTRNNGPCIGSRVRTSGCVAPSVLEVREGQTRLLLRMKLSFGPSFGTYAIESYAS
jgi:hypothetical protein